MGWETFKTRKAAKARIDNMRGWVDRDQELTPCPFCNARVHTTESGELVGAVELTRIGNGYDAECLACGKAWGVLPDDPEWPE